MSINVLAWMPHLEDIIQKWIQRCKCSGLIECLCLYVRNSSKLIVPAHT